MQLFQNHQPSKPLLSSHGKHSLFLFIGAILVAILTALVAEFFGLFLALLSPLLLLLMLIAIWDYRYGVLLTVFILPLSSTNLLPKEIFGVAGLNPLNVLLLFSALSMLLTSAVQPSKILIPTWSHYFFCYLGVFMAATLHGVFHIGSIPDYFKALGIIKSNSVGEYLSSAFLKPIITLSTVFMLSVALRNAQRPNFYLVPLFCSAIVFPLAVFFYVSVSGASLSELASTGSRGYLSVVGMHANELGLLLNMAFALALFCCAHAPGFLAKSLLGAVTIILAVAVALTFSRGAYLGSFAVIAYFLYSLRRFGILLSALLLLPFAILLVPQPVLERATIGIQNQDVDAISAGRVDDIWRPLLPEVMTSPIIGHGLGSILWSEAAQQRTILPVSHPHSAYLGMLLDFGILGTVVIFFFLRHVWRLFRRLGRYAPDPIWRGFFGGATACVLLLLVQGLTDDSFMPSRTQPFFWMSYGLAMGVVARMRARGYEF